MEVDLSQHVRLCLRMLDFVFLFDWVVWVWRSWFQHGLSAKSGIPFLEIDAFLCDRPLGLNFIFGNEVLMEGVGFGWREPIGFVVMCLLVSVLCFLFSFLFLCYGGAGGNVPCHNNS